MMTQEPTPKIIPVIEGNDSGFEKVDLTGFLCKHGLDECITCAAPTDVKDMVNRPAHYNNGDIECIDAIKAMLGEEGFVAYCRGNAVKYQWRAGLKFNRREDMRKSVWYSRMADGDDPRLDVTPVESLYQKDIPVPDLRTKDCDCRTVPCECYRTNIRDMRED